MIVVTGTKRSGTSMWMQILRAAGLPVIGTEFPLHWQRSIGEANPRGFWESKFRSGVYYRTNPDPKTGDFLHPKQVKTHAVKVFIPGLIRSDMAYLHRVIATVRHWSEYPGSIARLYAMEDAFEEERAAEVGASEEERVARREKLRASRPSLPPILEWWFESYDLIRDISTRRYPTHITTYAKVVVAPSEVLPHVFSWLGVGDLDAALASVDPQLHRTPPQVDTSLLQPEDLRVFEDLYTAIHEKGALSAALFQDMNDTQKRLTARWGELSRERD